MKTETNSSKTLPIECRGLLPPYNDNLSKVEILNYAEYLNDNTMLTIVFREEDHTVGNILKEVICNMKGVEFCGYNVPHPLEDKILFRIQTYKGYSAGDILMEAFQDLDKIFESIENKFSAAYIQHSIKKN